VNNYWSVRRGKLIQMELNLEELEERPTNTIDGFRKIGSIDAKFN
jgi:cyanophycin synthetase